jgi:putative DNA methylase
MSTSAQADVAGARRDKRAGSRVRPAPIVSPLRHLNVGLVDSLARKETRNREVHLPPITTYRWWARRTESINGAIIDAFSLDRPRRLLIADPFAGGGVIPLAARLRGHQVYAQELNPWAAAGLVGMLSLPEGRKLRAAGERLQALAQPDLESAYATTFSDGEPAEISHTLRVAVSSCSHCGHRQRVFPHALISLLVRRERHQSEAFLACPNGHLLKGRDAEITGCPDCGALVDPAASYSRSRTIRCTACDRDETLEARAARGAWVWEPVLVERSKGRAREIALAGENELELASVAQWGRAEPLGEIPAGKETRVLLRHGFSHWHDLYPLRQRVILERLLILAAEAAHDDRELNALRLAIVGSAEMAGYLSRWDRFYLKSYESMAGHRFNFTLLPVEPNVWGATASGRGTVSRRIQAIARAAEWLADHAPSSSRVEGPLSADGHRTPIARSVDVRVVEGSSERMRLQAATVDLVLTDPPYHDDVQYSELSFPLRAWADHHMNRLEAEALVNQALEHNDRGDEYRLLLQRIFGEARRTMKDDGHLIFSYANRDPAAWVALFEALQGAELRAAAFTVLHSENETDLAKRGIRSCTMDLLMDLVPVSTRKLQQWAPASLPNTSEGDFLGLVGAQFLNVGSLRNGWVEPFVASLRATTFLAGA